MKDSFMRYVLYETWTQTADREQGKVAPGQGAREWRGVKKTVNNSSMAPHNQPFHGKWRWIPMRMHQTVISWERENHLQAARSVNENAADGNQNTQMDLNTDISPTFVIEASEHAWEDLIRSLPTELQRILYFIWLFITFICEPKVGSAAWMSRVSCVQIDFPELGHGIKNNVKY